MDRRAVLYFNISVTDELLVLSKLDLPDVSTLYFYLIFIGNGMFINVESEPPLQLVPIIVSLTHIWLVSNFTYNHNKLCLLVSYSIVIYTHFQCSCYLKHIP